MRKLLACSILILSIVACAAPQVSLPVGVASVMYANARADYAIAKTLVVQACKGGKLDKEACEAAQTIDVRVQTYKQAVERALMNPQQPIDWAQVLQYTQSVSELLLKIGVIP